MTARSLRVLVSITTIGVLVAIGAPAWADELPEDPAEAMAYYEDGIEDWLDGPVQYLILEAEREEFESLTRPRERELFIQEFWERRDPDLRDRRNPFKEAFYERVAHANRRFRELHGGWKSDRGMIHVMLGQPHHVRRNGLSRNDVEVWTYRTIGDPGDELPFDSDFGEIRIAFVSRPQTTRYQIAGGFAGLGAYPTYVLEVLEIARIAAIDPALERGELQ